MNYGRGLKRAGRKYMLDLEDIATREVAMMKNQGGDAIVELTCGGLSPDPEGLKRIAAGTGVHLIMGCGYYVNDYQDPEPRPLGRRLHPGDRSARSCICRRHIRRSAELQAAGRRAHPAPEVLAIGDRWATIGPNLTRRLGTPRTLCHGDFRLDNLRFANDDEVIAFDWQLLTLANGVTDLAYFVSQSVRTDERRGQDRALLDVYLGRLAEHGVVYDIDDAWEVYRTAVLAMIIFPVSLYGGFEDLPPLGQRTTEAMLDRALATISELEAWDVPGAH